VSVMREASLLPLRIGRKIGAARDKHALEADFRRLIQTADQQPLDRETDGARIGVAVLSSGTWHLVIEALLAHALMKRGARPELLVCDLPELPICDERTIHSRSPEQCGGCVADKRSLIDASGLRWQGLSTFVAGDAIARARAAIAAVADDDLASVSERGWPIGQWLHVSASHYLRCDARGDQPEKIDARRRLLTSAVVLVAAVDGWLDQCRPDIVIVESGAHLEWRVVLELSRARGIPVVCREMGKGGWDRHLYALNHDCLSPDLDLAWAQARQEPLDREEAAAVAAFLDDLPAKTFTSGDRIARSGSSRDRLGVPASARMAVAFANVTWDLATAGRDVAFDGVVDWLRDTATALSGGTDTHLVIRAHPAEASAGTREPIVEWLRSERPGGLRHVTIVGPDNNTAASDLIADADLVLVYNSTAGLEAAAQEKPVVVCGAPHFRGRGFTVDVETREGYRDALVAWMSGSTPSMPVDAATLAGRYAHLFYLRYHVTMNWTTSPIDAPFALTICSLDELLPGRNPALDHVCESILRAEQPLLPRRRAAGVW